MTFFSPDREPISELETRSPNLEVMAGLRQVVGESAARSDYEFRKAVLEANPGMLTIWISKKEAIQAATLLSIKDSIDSIHGETGIFTVEANGWKGFQFDDPAQKPKRVQVDLYNSQNQHIRMIFQSKKDAQMELQQGDINLVVGTLRAVDHESSK
ncbi:MAG TPA: hypothetical protein VEI73_16085 [Candidatus Acidoferrum sp.]|nr:hypothetical protein [Candidatus Acidoferrum sp.]